MRDILLIDSSTCLIANSRNVSRVASGRIVAAKLTQSKNGKDPAETSPMEWESIFARRSHRPHGVRAAKFTRFVSSF